MLSWNAQANEIFLKALEIPSSEARQAYLDQVSRADPGLRAEAERLLSAHQAAATFLEQSVVLLPDAATSGIQEHPGSLIGPYELLEQIGEGGFGVVFMAQQERPIRRKVALKILKPGMDTRQVIARFEVERQVLAMMDHPNIARVLDAGTTSTGRPYFAMELVKGISITEYCDRSRLGVPERLALFVCVCSAVQHAHQRGIIHRDLKPSNVLVTLQDGRPLVKVIDFGIAKATQTRLTEKTHFTGFAQMVGTPLYMSPEQATLCAVEVDTRSDVYSLGVLLYELLTGTTPFEREKLAGARYDELRRIICEVDPPLPSARISTLAEDARVTLAGLRQLDARQIGRHLRGDLDWIVMKALEKDRSRRYDSPGALAADLERYLRDEPVQACPPSASYRLRKLARRHKGVLVLAATALVALLAGTVVATWQAVEATQARKLAEKEAAHSRDLLRREQAAREEADMERDRARHNADHARRLLYAGDMRLACYAWQRNDVTRMRALLDRHRPADDQTDLRGFEWHLLSNQREVAPREIFRSEGPLYFVRFSPDGRRLAAAGADAHIRIFDAASLQLTGDIPSGQREVNGLDFSPDSSRLASAGDDGSVAVWEVATGREQLRIQAHADIAFQVLFARGADVLMSCGRDPVVRLWHTGTGESAGELAGHSAAVEAMALSPDGNILAAVAKNSVGLQWDLRQRSRVSDLVVHPESSYSCVAFSPTGLLVATGQKNGMLALYRSNVAALVALQRFTDAVQSLAFAPSAPGQSCWLAVGCRDGSIHLFPVDYGFHASGVVPDARQINRARQWQGHSMRVYAMAFSPDGKQLLTAGEDGRLVAWDWEAPQSSKMIRNPVKDFAFLDANQLITCGETLSVYSLETGEHLRDLPGSSNQWQDVTVAADVGKVFAMDVAGCVHAWLLDGSHRQCAWPPPEGPENTDGADLSVCRDGCCLAREIGQPNGGRFVELRAGGSLTRIPCNLTHGLTHSLNGRAVAFAHDKDIRVVDAVSGKELSTLGGHRTTIEGLAFSAEGDYLASVSADRTVRVWDWREGKELWSEIAHANRAICVGFSPDGETVATAGEDGMLRLWRWKLGTLVLEYPLVVADVAKLAFSPDGMRIVVVEAEGLRIYDADPRQ